MIAANIAKANCVIALLISSDAPPILTFTLFGLSKLFILDITCRVVPPIFICYFSRYRRCIITLFLRQFTWCRCLTNVAISPNLIVPPVGFFKVILFNLSSDQSVCLFCLTLTSTVLPFSLTVVTVFLVNFHSSALQVDLQKYHFLPLYFDQL